MDSPKAPDSLRAAAAEEFIIRKGHAKVSPVTTSTATATRQSPNCGRKPSGVSRTRIAQAVSLAIAAGTSSARYAQQLEEVVVAATKRSESVLDVSVAMAAMTGSETRMFNLNDIKDLISFTPNISGNSKDSFLDTVAVRGIRTNLFGNGADTSIGMYVNGLCRGRTGSGVTSLFDVWRSEVLRGPLGFLLARNVVSGTFNVITEKASTTVIPCGPTSITAPISSMPN